VTRRRPLLIGPGGVAAEMLEAEQRAQVHDAPLRPPSTETAEPEAGAGPFWGARGSEVNERPQLEGQRPQHARFVRVMHTIDDQGRTCWAFTITKAAFEAYSQGGSLSSVGATYPDGLPVVPAGTDPSTVHLRCGSCGASRVLCIALRYVAM
jgi:hypothetical protein